MRYQYGRNKEVHNGLIQDYVPGSGIKASEVYAINNDDGELHSIWLEDILVMDQADVDKFPGLYLKLKDETSNIYPHFDPVIPPSAAPTPAQPPPDPEPPAPSPDSLEPDHQDPQAPAPSPDSDSAEPTQTPTVPPEKSSKPVVVASVLLVLILFLD